MLLPTITDPFFFLFAFPQLINLRQGASGWAVGSTPCPDCSVKSKVTSLIQYLPVRVTMSLCVCMFSLEFALCKTYVLTACVWKLVQGRMEVDLSNVDHLAISY